jgi:NADH:ubiquinone oxidoreductase subunit 5 (subunit L)/multisubunit Na+/H+ antiporter MnhA subunit
MVMNRISDIFLLFALIIIVYNYYVLEYVIIFDIYILTIIFIKYHYRRIKCKKINLIRSLLFLGAIGKSAQSVYIRDYQMPWKVPLQ